jgi:Cellulose binding domain
VKASIIRKGGRRVSRDLMAMEPVGTPDSTPAADPGGGQPPTVPGEQPPVENNPPPAAAGNAWSWPRQRAPRIMAVVIAIAFIVVSVGYIRLVAAADRPSGIGTPHRAAAPSGAPSRHGAAGPVVPSTGSPDRIGSALGQSDGVGPSGSPEASEAPIEVEPTAEPTDEPTADPTEPDGPPAIPVDPVGRDDPPPAELTASVSTSVRLLPPGYVGQVVVSNIGGTTAVGWQVSLSIGGHARITAVAGARVKQVAGNVVTFGPDGTNVRIAPDRSVRFQFRVRGIGVSAPRNCRVNGQPC